MLQKLDPSNFELPVSSLSAGPAPMLTWISTEKFVVDDSYQREVGRRGRHNVQHIAENFDWSKFAPVIVAPIEGGLYAIVDGQHRTTAAMIRGIAEVPCQVVQADHAKQAAAYAAVNGNITKTTPQQLFHARLAAGDPNAAELAEVCAAGGVVIIRRNIVQARMEVGQTQAVGALSRCLRDFGRDTLITALQCITETADGNPGFVRATIVEGLCGALQGTPWRDAGEALLRAMDDFSFADMWGEVSDGRDQIFPATVRRLISERITEHLEMRLPRTENRKAA
jgi:hypothetical protein